MSAKQEGQKDGFPRKNSRFAKDLRNILRKLDSQVGNFERELRLYAKKSSPAAKSLEKSESKA